MKICVKGNGSFGRFLSEELPNFGFTLDDEAESVILAVPISAYNELGEQCRDKHLINVCSVQGPSTDILLEYTERVTSIHPLFGARTPIEKRNSILTYVHRSDIEAEFLDRFYTFSNFQSGIDSYLRYSVIMSPNEHDDLMNKTHVAAIRMAKIAKIFIKDRMDIPDNLVPHSFRLLRQFVKTLDDMPKGTMESILANPYI